MDKQQKLHYQQSIEKYLANRHAYDLFQNLIKSLILKQPDEPISFLIEKLSFQGENIQIDNQQTISKQCIGVGPKNIDEQINQKKLVLQNAESNFLLSIHNFQVIEAETLKEMLFNKIGMYFLNRNKFKELQFILNSYQKLYEEVQFTKVTKQVRQFGSSTHRFLNELHFDHERASQIVKILFQDGFLMTLDLNKPQLSIKEMFLGLARRVFSCCERDLNSFAFLIIQMTDWARMKDLTANQIDDSLKAVIEHLQKHYPATQKKATQISQKNFEFEQEKDEKTFIKLKGQTGKQKWANLNQNILEIAKYAEQQEAQLKYITKKSCLDQNGTSFKTGTKIKGQQTIERVKEKLVQQIFLEKNNEKPYKQKFKEKFQKECNKFNTKPTLEQFLKKEKENYNKFVENWIADQQQIQFTVDDMVRGKCMFNSTEDIYNAAQKIIEKCKEKNIGIVKIKNRLNKKTSDLVFKLKMKKVVAQFQLALKFNVVKNQFNHKIYELLRSPGYSVTQTVFQNKEKSQRFLWDLQSMLENKKQLPSSIKSDFLQYIKRKNPKFAWDGSILQLKPQGKNKIDTQEKNQQNKKFWTAIFLQQNFKYEAAIEKLKDAQKTVNINKQPPTQILNQLGRIYDIQGSYHQALKFYNQCLEIREKIKGKDSIECAQTLNNIGLVYYNQGNYPQALKFYNRSLDIREKIKGNDSIQCAQTLNNIGIVYDSQGNYNQALKYYKRCLQIREKIKGKQSIQCAQTLNNIGLVYNNKGNYPQALEYYNRSLQIREKIKGKDSIQCAQTLNNIGLVYNNQLNYPQALKYYNRRLDIIEKIKGRESIESAQTFNNIGIVYDSQGNYPQALKFYNQCLEIREKIKGKDSIDCAQVLNNIGSVYYCQSNLTQAFKNYVRCLEIAEKVKGKSSIDYATTLNNIGKVYKSQRNYLQAAKCFQKSYEIFNTILGPEHPTSKTVQKNVEQMKMYPK